MCAARRHIDAKGLSAIDQRGGIAHKAKTLDGRGGFHGIVRAKELAAECVHCRRAIDETAEIRCAHVSIGEREFRCAFQNVMRARPNGPRSVALLHERRRRALVAFLGRFRAIELNKEDVFAHFYLANILKYLGQYDLAINEYQTVIGIIPDYSWAYFNLGQIAYELGETESALQYLQKTLQYNPKDTEAIKIIVQIYTKQERYTEALDTLQTGLEANVNNGDLFYLSSRVFKLMGNEENSYLALQQAVLSRDTLTFDFDKINDIYKILTAKRTTNEQK